MSTARYPKELRVKRVFRHTRIAGALTIRQKRYQNKIQPKFIETDRFVNLENPISVRGYEYYKKRVENPMTREKWQMFMKQFLKRLSNSLTENEAGVFIKKFGYFCIFKHPKKKVNKGGYKNIHTMGHLYLPTFIPIRKDATMQQWTMDRAFHKGMVNMKMGNQLRAGKKYKTAFTVLQNLYGTTQAFAIEKQIYDNDK
jgi:hypothetical protein